MGGLSGIGPAPPPPRAAGTERANLLDDAADEAEGDGGAVDGVGGAVAVLQAAEGGSGAEGHEKDVPGGHPRQRPRWVPGGEMVIGGGSSVGGRWVDK